MLTKTYSEPNRPKALSRSKAWAYAALNQLAFPGAGTVMAGRRVGYIQATIMVVGFVLTMTYLLAVIGSVVNFAANGTVSEEEYHKQYQVYTWAGKYGLALSVAAWCWSLVSSIAIIRNVRKEPPLLS
jgi:hypothetical protein